MGKLQSTLRRLRRNQTESERIVWEAVRQFRPKGYAFRRQHPVARVQINSAFYYFIADFVCLRAKLVVEIDGPIHNTMKDVDAARQMVIENHGYYVLRYTNEGVANNLVSILEEIELIALERIHA